MFVFLACSDVSNSSWYGRLEASGWLTHVEQLLRAVKHVAHSVYQEGKRREREKEDWEEEREVRDMCAPILLKVLVLCCMALMVVMGHFKLVH